jgi:PKD repeat protein
MVDFEWGTNSTCANTGCDEVWFCATGIEPTSDICLSWDFGDGNIYNPSLPDCPIHCYTTGGNKNVCLTAYCCADGINQASSTTVCNTIEVDCGFVDVECTGDYDLDGFIGVIDLLELLGAYGGACE